MVSTWLGLTCGCRCCSSIVSDGDHDFDDDFMSGWHIGHKMRQCQDTRLLFCRRIFGRILHKNWMDVDEMQNLSNIGCTCAINTRRMWC